MIFLRYLFTHPLEELILAKDLEQTDVMEENYVVNNARFDLGDNLDENPFVFAKQPDGRRKSVTRKGSNAWKESVKQQESYVHRASMKLAGLHLITSGRVTSGLDASLYLVAALVSHDSAQEVVDLTVQLEQWRFGQGDQCVKIVPVCVHG